MFKNGILRVRHPIKHFWRDEAGAVAATYAIAIVGLLAIAGVGFDYTRMVALDSELQNGADQAAIAGATQLDRKDGACARAGNSSAAMLRNITLLANDGRPAGINVTVNGGTTVGIANDQCTAFSGVRFYREDKTTLATTDETAYFVEVSVGTRTAEYVFTPVVGAFADEMNASALAGVAAAICKVPPVMICNPGENSTPSDPNFTVANYIGKGLKLVSVGGGGGWAPGNFGYLQTGAGSNGAPGLREALGWNTAPGDCLQATGVDTKPGATVTVTDALNTRFDIYENNVSCPSGGKCEASINSVKDFQRPANASASGSGQSCGVHNSGWQLPSGYYGESAISGPLASTVIPTAMGHPRDICHLSGTCSGPVGDGSWDRDAYFRTNYVRGDGSRWNSAAWQSNTGLPSSATRYQVYQWEMNNRGTTFDGATVLGSQPIGATGNTLKSHGQPICSGSSSINYGAGTIPSSATPDRRKISMAVVNCTAQGVSGNSTNVPVIRWIDVFLVEPSHNRDKTNAGDIYIEIIGETLLGGGGSSAQTVSKAKPYLIE